MSNPKSRPVPADDGGASEFLDVDAAELLPKKSYIVPPADETDPNWKMTDEQLAELLKP